MIRRFICTAISLVSAFTAAAATQAIYVNSTPVNGTAPQIDATRFVNQSIFNVTTIGGLPYSTLNTLFFTNRPSGNMSCTPGFRFDFFTNNFRYWMDTWINQGSITGTAVILISSTNIVNSGSLHSYADGLIRMTGKNLDLSRGKIRAGSPESIFFSGGSTFNGTNYSSAAGVSDLYWGAGTNNHVDANGMAMRLNGFSFNDLGYTPPFISSPFHQVIEPLSFGGGGTFLFTNLVSVGGFNYGAFAYRAQTGPTNFIIQVVFAPTNNFDTNFSTAVRFYANFGNPVAIPVVEFKAVDFDIVTLRQNTNAVYLVDSGGIETNYFLAQPFNGGTSRRPNIYELFRNEPFEFSLGTNGNTIYTPDLIYNPTYQLATVTNAYAGYSASINSGGTTGDPTNLVGRVEITGETVNLDQARVRAESTVTIRTSNLTSNKLARVDAPFLNYDLRSVQPQMIISNLAPSSVRRLSGDIAAWTGRWKNSDGTNEFDFHVLIVDNFLSSASPVVVNEFAARASHIDISDILTVRKSFILQGTHLNVSGGLTLPFGSSWASTNVIGVYYFTNSGAISIYQSGSFGTPPGLPYQTFINSGTISAANLDIRAVDLKDSGALVANGGSISIIADQLDLHGKPTILFTNVLIDFFGRSITNIVTNSFGPKVAADSEVQLEAQSICLSNAIIYAGGGISMTATDKIVDSGQQAINEWTTLAGFEIPSLPPTSDLLATHIRSVANQSSETIHIWPGVDHGAMASGYQNNLAVGKLTLDGGDFSSFRFTGAGTQCALYVDYLELVNTATNYNDVLTIDDNIVIYYANANISPSKLDGRHGGHLRWVKGFTGPLSSTNIVYPSGRTYTFNAGLARDKDLDSDGDGIVNGEDPTPFYVEESIDLRIGYTNAPAPRALLSWRTLTGANNQVEYRSSIASGSWQVLTNFTQTAASGRVTVQAPIAGSTRFYRVRVQPPSLD